MQSSQIKVSNDYICNGCGEIMNVYYGSMPGAVAYFCSESCSNRFERKNRYGTHFGNFTTESDKLNTDRWVKGAKL